MKVLITLLLLTSLIGCGKKETIQLDDNGSIVQSNVQRIELLEAKDAVQDLRLDAVEANLASLEDRVEVNEDDIDANESDIADLFNDLGDLEGDLSDLRDDLNSEVAALRRADRQTRRLIRREVRSLRRDLSREIRNRRIADSRLQDNIDDIERDLNRFESRQRFFNYMISGAIARTNYRITLLQQNIGSQISNLDNRITVNEGDITNIQNNVTALQNQTSSLQNQIDSLESEMIAVVYPCGEGNSEEVLLQTEEGLLAYFQTSRTINVDFSSSIDIPAQDIPAHTDRFCNHTYTGGWYNGHCNSWGSNQVGAYTIPAASYSVGGSDSFQVIDKAYLDILGDGNYGTTDGYSCNFQISNGQLVEGV